MKRFLVGVMVLGVLVAALTTLRRPTPSIVGLWEVGSPRALTDELRFYYFHDGDKGLYRYGKVGYNNTASFDWHVSGDELTLTFRKTGVVVRTRFSVEERDGSRALVLLDDPRVGGRQRYVYRPAALELESGPLSLSQSEEAPQGKLSGRMWYDGMKYATGGMGFRMYQLAEHSLPGGRMLGWYHVGDFDDWSTETLDYRELPAALELHFSLRDERSTTPIIVEQGRERRFLQMASDPRDFGARARFGDVGKSF